KTQCIIQLSFHNYQLQSAFKKVFVLQVPVRSAWGRISKGQSLRASFLAAARRMGQSYCMGKTGQFKVK
ncbi:hypothetical protein NDU88_002307, partial [Pleurodeles waltl]